MLKIVVKNLDEGIYYFFKYIVIYWRLAFFYKFDFIKCFGVSADNAANIKAASHIHIPCDAQNLNLICKELIK